MPRKRPNNGLKERSKRHTGNAALRALLSVVAPACLAVILTGCSSLPRHQVSSRTPEGPASSWVPPAKALPPPAAPEETTAIPQHLLESKESWTLEDIVDLALRNNPNTRATWAAARASAARLGSEQGAYFPEIDGSANYSTTKSSFSQQLSFDRTSYEAALTLHFLLFDFGQRGGRIEEARQAMYAANWSHNAVIQDVILVVERAYYQYLHAKGVREANTVALKEAEASLDAAEDRHKAGLATIADVLQAKSNYSQKKLELQEIEGQILNIRGTLATTIGLSPTVDYDVGVLPSDLPVQEVSQTVDELIREAETFRPDLAAAHADVLGARAHVKSIKAERWPTITFDGNMSRRFYDNPDDYSDNYTYGIYLDVPLFTGFSQQNDILEAQSRADHALQQYEILKNRVALGVWIGYYDLKTASERLTTTREFLESATESQNVALGRYRAGVGSILEVLTAQTALEDARAQDLQARTDWFLALSLLAHATGRLGTSQSLPSAQSQSQPEKDSGR